jgi:hypothetical protein
VKISQKFFDDFLNFILFFYIFRILFSKYVWSYILLTFSFACINYGHYNVRSLYNIKIKNIIIEYLFQH